MCQQDAVMFMSAAASLDLQAHRLPDMSFLGSCTGKYRE